MKPWEIKIEEAKANHYAFVVEIIEAARLYRDCAIERFCNPISHSSAGPEDNEEGREWLRVIAAFHQARGRLLNACLCSYSPDIPIALAANTWIVCKVRAQGDAEVSMGEHPDSSARMHDVMEAEERLMEACGLASAASHLGRSSSNRGRPSIYEEDETE